MPWLGWSLAIFFFFFRFYLLFMRDTEKEAEGEAGSLQEARCGTPSWDPLGPRDHGRGSILNVISSRLASRPG